MLFLSFGVFLLICWYNFYFLIHVCVHSDDVFFWLCFFYYRKFVFQPTETIRSQKSKTKRDQNATLTPQNDQSTKHVCAFIYIYFTHKTSVQLLAEPAKTTTTTTTATLIGAI